MSNKKPVDIVKEQLEKNVKDELNRIASESVPFTRKFLNETLMGLLGAEERFGRIELKQDGYLMKLLARHQAERLNKLVDVVFRQWEPDEEKLRRIVKDSSEYFYRNFERTFRDQLTDRATNLATQIVSRLVNELTGELDGTSDNKAIDPTFEDITNPSYGSENFQRLLLKYILGEGLAAKEEIVDESGKLRIKDPLGRMPWEDDYSEE